MDVVPDSSLGLSVKAALVSAHPGARLAPVIAVLVSRMPGGWTARVRSRSCSIRT